MHVYLLKLSNSSPTKRISFTARLFLGQVSRDTLITVHGGKFPRRASLPNPSPRIINQNQRIQPRWYHETGHSCQRRLAKTKYKDSDTSKLAHDTKKALQPYATTVYLEEEYLVTALVPSEMACLESSPLNTELAYHEKENK